MKIAAVHVIELSEKTFSQHVLPLDNQSALLQDYEVIETLCFWLEHESKLFSIRNVLKIFTFLFMPQIQSQSSIETFYFGDILLIYLT